MALKIDAKFKGKMTCAFKNHMVLESIHRFIIELHVLQCLFVRGSNEKQRSGRIISNFTK